MSADVKPMDSRHLDALVAVERSYWWHVAKRALILEILSRRCPPPARLVEGGIGGGANLLALRERGYDVSGFDVMPEAVERCQSLGLDDVRLHDLEDAWPVARGPAQVVILLDVIEHVADPVAVLRNAADALGPGGEIILTVPAIPALFGPWDRMLGHHRRYSARLLRTHAREAGLRPVWVSHWNAFSLPAALAVRSAEKLGVVRGRGAEFPPVSPALNALLIALAGAERTVIHATGLPAGLSLVGVFKR